MNNTNETQAMRDAKYRARCDWKDEGAFKNPYDKGTLESVCYLSEAHKITFEWDLTP